VVFGSLQWFFPRILGFLPWVLVARSLGLWVPTFSASQRAQVLTLVFLGFFITTVRIPPSFLGFWFVQQALYGVASLNAPSNIGMESGGMPWAHWVALYLGQFSVLCWGYLDLNSNSSQVNAEGKDAMCLRWARQRDNWFPLFLQLFAQLRNSPNRWKPIS